MKTRMRKSPKSVLAQFAEDECRRLVAASIPKEDLKMPVEHVIDIPIYRPVLVGEKVLATDRRCWIDKLVGPESSDINALHNGSHLYLRPITTLTLQVAIK